MTDLIEEITPLPPQYTKIGRDITVEDYLNGTTEDHNNHSYFDWKRKQNEQVRIDGKINKAQLSRFMDVSDATTNNWLIADRKVGG